MCIVGKKYRYPFILQMNLKEILVKNDYIMWTNDIYTQRAMDFAQYLTYKSGNSSHYYIMGDYLGYPKEDVDFFININRLQYDVKEL